MTNLIVEISKYLMILLMAVYTYANFRFFSFPDMERKRRVCARQNRAMFAIHFLAYLVMFLKTEDEGMQAMLLAFYGAQVVFFLCYIYLYRLLYRNVSRLLVNNACMLLCVGFIMLTRLSMAKGLDKALRQFAIVVISAALAWLVPYIMERVWQLYKLQWVYAGAGLLILLVVWAAGNESFGAQLSLTIAGVSIQPSEFVKLTFVFFVASMFYQSTDFKTIFLTTAVAGAHVLVLVLSKDLGSALIFFVTYLLMLFVATGSWVYLITGSALGTGAALAAYQLFDHVRRRVAAWSNPWADIENKGYQITQSLFAICVLLICLGCFIQFMMIAARMQAVFYKLIAFGLGVEYIVQVFLTVGGVTKFIPSTGVTLPFVSYGGSSILGTFLLFGIIQGLYILKRNDEEETGEEVMP